MYGFTIYTQGTSSDDTPIVMVAMQPWNMTGSVPLKIFNPEPDVQDDSCDADKVAAAGPYNNTIVLYGRSSKCQIFEQARNFGNNGATNVLLYNSPAPAPFFFFGPDPEGSAGMLTYEQGIALKKLVGTSDKVSIDFSRQEPRAIPNPNNGGLMNRMSQMSPSWDGFGAPSVSAPGSGVMCASPLGESCPSPPYLTRINR